MLVISERIRIEWGHCDPAHIIYNPHYFDWMDQGCHSLFKAAGVAFAEMIAGGSFIGCPLITNEGHFHRPAVYGDLVVRKSQIESFGNSSFRTLHQFYRGDDLLMEGREVRIWAVKGEEPDRPIRAMPVPADVRARVEVDKTIDVTP